MAKGIKDEPYTEESKSLDLEEFRSRLEQILQTLEDPRKEDNKKFSLFVVIAIIFCAVVSGANSISAVHRYAIAKKKWLATWLDLKDDVPSYDTFWWLLVRLDPLQVEGFFRQWVDALSEQEIGDTIAIDGKRVKGASNKSHSRALLHMVSAWSSVRGIILGQVKTEEKSNEITAIPELLKGLDIKGATVTVDAMGCQKEIAKNIVEKGGDYILMVKENQPSLYAELENYFKQAERIDFEGIVHDKFIKKDKGHGRQEHREVYVTDDIEWLPILHEWLGLKSIVMVRSFRTLKGEESQESRYYISTLPPKAEQISRAVRNHWGIENKVHWVLDMNFLEDLSQISIGHAAENFSILRRLTLNVLRLDTDKKKSLKGRREIAGWDDDYMTYLLKLAAIKKF